MKKIFVSIAFFFGMASSLQADEFGAGIFLGEPTGFSGIYKFQDNMAVDLNLSYSFQSYFHIFGDYQYRFPGFLKSSNSNLKPLTGTVGVGPGLRISSKEHPQDGDDRTIFYARFPFGAEWRFAKPSLGIFGEVAPGMAIAPEVFAVIQGGIGLRYYF